MQKTFRTKLKYVLKKQRINKNLKLLALKFGAEILKEMNETDRTKFLYNELKTMKELGKVDGIIPDEIGLHFIVNTGNNMFDYFENDIKTAEASKDEHAIAFISKMIMAAMTSAYFALCDINKKHKFINMVPTIQKPPN